MEQDLPINWTETNLDTIAQVQSGGTPSRSNNEYWNGNIPWVKISDIQTLFVNSTDEYISEQGLKNSSARIFPRGTILFTIFATIGKVGILNIDAATNQAIAGITPSKFINSKYLTYSLIELSNSILLEGKGVAQKNINQSILKSTKIPLPPFPEQQRIVAKLDALFGQIDRIKTSMERIPQLLKDFRQKVLTQAVTGKLTEEWREGRELEEIDISFECETDFDLLEIPESWIYSKIGLIGDVKGGKRLPLGDELIAEVTAHPYIRARDLKQGTVLTDNLMYISEETHKKIQRYIVKEGDVYITIVGAKIGDAGVIPLEMNGANLTENASKITNFKDIEGDYLSIWLRSPICQDYILKSIMSAAQGKLALTRIKELPVYLTAIEEQQEIVRRVELLFAKADQIEDSYQKLKEKIEQLPQALLAKAFRGELVEQLPTDGDARDLLEQIKQAKAGLEKGGKSKKLKVKDEVRMVAEDGVKYGK